MRRIAIFGVMILPLLLAGVDAVRADEPPPISTGTTANGWFGKTTSDGGGKKSDITAKPVVQTRTDDCGAPQPLGKLAINDNDCTVAVNQCAGQPAVSATGQPLTVIATEVTNAAGNWVLGPVNCAAADTGPPAIPAAAIHDAFTKLVPKPTIATAPPNAQPLVNLETLLWLNTTKTVDLGITPLLGHQVDLVATVQTVTWNFGDHHTDTTTGPGRPFLDSDYCATISCPAWYGHIYTTTGPMTVTATITWTGRYNIDGSTYLPITGTVTTAPTTTKLEVQQSLSVLVPNPGQTD